MLYYLFSGVIAGEAKINPCVVLELKQAQTWTESQTLKLNMIRFQSVSLGNALGQKGGGPLS